jgi:hypothetical protein
MVVVRLLSLVLGLAFVAYTGVSAIRTFILPRGTNVFLTRIVFRIMLLLFRPWIKLTHSYDSRDRVMALYAPLSLVALPAVWMSCVLVGYMGMYWGVGVHPLSQAFLLSGSSLLTLGFAPASTVPLQILAFTEATIGLGLVALLIAYLPTMYLFTARNGGQSARRTGWVAAAGGGVASPGSSKQLVASDGRAVGFLGGLVCRPR